MADESQTTIRAIDWKALFPFLNLFKAFRVAIHPSKLILGLAALLLIYAGGRVMDAVWPDSHSALPGEVKEYEQYVDMRNPPAAFDDLMDKNREELRKNYVEMLLGSKVFADLKDDAARKKAEEAAKSFDHQRKVKAYVMTKRDEAMVKAKETRDDRIKKADEAHKKRTEDADKLTDTTAKEDEKKAATVARDKEKKDAEETYQSDLRSALAEGHVALRQIDRSVPHGVFDSLFIYETRQINAVVSSVLAGNWTRAGAEQAVARRPAGRDARTADGEEDLGTVGVVPAVQNFFTVGPAWLLRYHLVYAIIFIAWFLLIWAVFGGAICRIAAVHVARDEKISVRQALKFSIGKVLSFVFAPVIPLLIVLIIGLLLAVAGLLFYVPWVGPILAGALLIIALIAAIVVTLVLFGTVGGLSLMYPTVAVEGSDSFDAISRSFSYVFAKPWRMLFYMVVTIAYGAVCYLFVKFFIYVTLAVTHFFVGWWLKGQPGLWFPEMWPAPTLTSLPYDVAFSGLKTSEQLAAFFICFWVYLLIGMLGAFAISFYFSASTIIYYLMRREVDATELDDVYIEESEDDLADIAPVSVAPATTGPTIVTPSTETPATGGESAPPATA